MTKRVHVIGNGDSVHLYQREERSGHKLACNQTPFGQTPDIYATCIVDFKFMDALQKGDLNVGGKWILGYRPKVFLENNTGFHMMRAQQIKEFYTHLPSYCWQEGKENKGEGYTRFNCGHMAVHYACNKMKADEVHMYGFDSMFDFNLNSYSDLVLNSDRGNTNNNRLSTNWRPVWEGIFHEFKDTKFIPHYTHNAIKIKHPGNVETRVYGKEKEEEKWDFNSLSNA